MVKLFSIATLGLSVLNAVTGAYVNPGACSGTCVNTHDPSVIRRGDGTYFRFSTGGGIAVHSAPDITGPWTYKGTVLPDGTSIKLWDGKMDVWAPDVQLVGNTYYLYYSAVRAVPFDGHNLAAIGVATSTTLDVGSWKDLGSTGVQNNDSSEYNAIDPNLFVEDDCNYMVFGSYVDGIFQVAMDVPPLSAVPNTYAKLAYEPSGNHADEGATMFKHGEYNYLFFSNGICCSFDTNKPTAGQEYKIKVCRSKPGIMDFRDANSKSCTEGGGTIAWSRTITCTGLVVRVCTMTQLTVRSCITTTSTPPSGMRTVKSSLAGTNLTSRVVGPSWYRLR